MRSTAPSNNGTFGGILMASVGQLLQLCITVFAALNRPFAEWNDVFPSAACVVSIVDRLVHHSEILVIEGESYRMREAKERASRKKKPSTPSARARKPANPTPRAEKQP